MLGSSPKHYSGTNLAAGGAGGGRMMLALVTAGSVGGLLFGYDTGIISGALVLLSHEFSLTTLEQELVVSICIAGAFVSAAVSGYLSDQYGRRLVVLASSVAFVLGSVLLCVATNTALLYAGRFVVGLGVGSASMIVPVLLSECAPAESRGAVVTCVNVAITLGQMLACGTAGLLSRNPYGWRIMLGIAAIPAVFQFLCFFFVIPESPRWLIAQGFVDKGTTALRQLRNVIDVRAELVEILASVQSEKDAIAAEFGRRSRQRERERLETLRRSDFDSTNAKANKAGAGAGESGDAGDGDGKSKGGSTLSPLPQPLAPPYQKQLEDLSPYGEHGSPLSTQPPVEVACGKMSFWENLVAKSTIRRALYIGIVLQITQQLAGINTVMYYSAVIFHGTGIVSQSTAIWLTLGTAFFNFIGSALGHRLTDRTGRRPLTLFSLLAVVVCLAGIAGTFYFNDLVLDVTTSSNSSTRRALSSGDPLSGSGEQGKIWSVFAAICVYLLVFSIGVGSTPWTYCSEIFPLSVRGVAASVTTSTNWLANFAVSVTFLTVVNRLGVVGSFLFYAW